jgi:hypothetical protein
MLIETLPPHMAYEGMLDWQREAIASGHPHFYHDPARHPNCFPFRKQWLFHMCDAKYRLLGGAAGPGKSRGILEEGCRQALEHDGVTTAIFRRSYPELAESVIIKFLQFVHPQWLGKKGYKYSESDHTVYWPNGSRTLFRYCATEKDAALHLGAEYQFIGIDELTQLPYIVWKLLTSRLRSPVAGTRPNAAGATNPGDIGSDWVKSLFIDGEPAMEMDETERMRYDPSEYAFIPAKVTDNPIYANDQNYMDILRKLPQREQARFLFGDWENYKGAYFSAWQPAHDTVPHDYFLNLWGPQPWQPIWISIDWGSTHHAYASWHTFVTLTLDEPEQPSVVDNSREGRHAAIVAEAARGNKREIASNFDVMITYREMLVKGLGEEALAEEIVRATPQSERPRVGNIFLSPDCGFSSELMRGYKIGSVFERHRMPRARAAFAERVDGLALMHEKLRAVDEKGDYFQSYDGEPWPKWCITDACKNAIKAIPWAVVNPKPGKDGDILAEGDSPLLDVLDGLRYGIASYQYGEAKPAAERKREVISKMPLVGSARWVADKMFDQAEKREEAEQSGGGWAIKSWRRRGRRGMC